MSTLLTPETTGRDANEAMDLLGKLLVYVAGAPATGSTYGICFWLHQTSPCYPSCRYDHYERLSADEALAHPYFQISSEED
jgi:hypothetical protein